MSLHPAFAGLVARMRAAPDPDVRAALARQATDLASLSGLSLEEAIGLLEPKPMEDRAEFRGQYVQARTTEDAETVANSTAQRVEDLLRADPSRSDRAIARMVPCSPTIVGRKRKRLGLTAAPRAVKRGDQHYSLRGKHGA